MLDSLDKQKGTKIMYQNICICRSCRWFWFFSNTCVHILD